MRYLDQARSYYLVQETQSFQKSNRLERTLKVSPIQVCYLLSWMNMNMNMRVIKVKKAEHCIICCRLEKLYLSKKSRWPEQNEWSRLVVENRLVCKSQNEPARRFNNFGHCRSVSISFSHWSHQQKMPF